MNRRVTYIAIRRLMLFVGMACIATQLTAQPLSRSFRAIELGMEFPAAEEAIAADPAFAFRGRPDVSMTLSDGEPMVDTAGRGFVDRGVFSFYEQRLYTFSLYLSTQRLDYLQLYNQLRSSYGEPTDLDPRRAFWEDEATRITLERPLTVTFLDMDVFVQRRDDNRREEAIEDVAREEFLELF